MNRIIKFRAWRDGKIVYGTDDLYSLVNALKLMEMPNGMEWMQFTGLTDKNGKEIYEGDILQGRETTDEYGSGFNYGGPVSWSDGTGGWVVIDEDDTWSLYDYDFEEVIGNIYENPELINPKEV